MYICGKQAKDQHVKTYEQEAISKEDRGILQTGLWSSPTWVQIITLFLFPLEYYIIFQTDDVFMKINPIPLKRGRLGKDLVLDLENEAITDAAAEGHVSGW